MLIHVTRAFVCTVVTMSGGAVALVFLSSLCIWQCLKRQHPKHNSDSPSGDSCAAAPNCTININRQIQTCTPDRRLAFVSRILQHFRGPNNQLVGTCNLFTVSLIFTALHGMQTRYSDENSVCPSVCPSVTRVDST